LGDAQGSFWIVFADAIDDASEVFRRGCCPANAHLRAKHSLYFFDNFVVLQQVAAANCGAALFDGLEEPGVVLQQSGDSMLHEFVRTPPGFRREIV
jgi:hypothetical protein